LEGGGRREEATKEVEVKFAGFAGRKKHPPKQGKPIVRWGHKVDRSRRDGWAAGEKN
jgi:hypothetical protein